MQARTLAQACCTGRPGGQAGGANRHTAATATLLYTPPPLPPLPTANSLTRRAAHAALAAVLAALACPFSPAAARGLGKYVRKRKLDPLASYVPPVLDARAQLARLPGSFDDPKEARRLLRSGAFEGLRDNVRAIGEYAAAAASADGAGQPQAPRPPPPQRLAADFFTALESLDLVLYWAVRDGAPTPTADANEKLSATLAAMDRLLATVPGDVLEAAQHVAGVGDGRSGGGAGPSAAAGAAAALSQILPGGAS
jgi:hypothetical protein